MAKKKKARKPQPGRTETIVIRCSPEEKKKIKVDAQSAGKSISEYGRRVLQKQVIKAALTEKELKAFAGLTDARGDLVNIQNALNATPESLKLKLFRNEKFMKRWILAIEDEVHIIDNVWEKITN